MYSSKIASIASFISFTSAITVSYSGFYDDDTASVTELACWKGGRIVEGQDWAKLGEVTYQIAGYEVSMVRALHSAALAGRSAMEIPVDRFSFSIAPKLGSGFETSFTVMNSLTGGKAEQLGRENITAYQTELLDCGVATEPTEEERKMVVGGNWYSNWFYDNFT